MTLGDLKNPLTAIPKHLVRGSVGRHIRAFQSFLRSSIFSGGEGSSGIASHIPNFLKLSVKVHANPDSRGYVAISLI